MRRYVHLEKQEAREFPLERSSSLIVLTQERSHGRRRQVAEKPASRTGCVAFPVKCLKSQFRQVRGQLGAKDVPKNLPVWLPQPSESR
jgi:hypothetical protein